MVILRRRPVAPRPRSAFVRDLSKSYGVSVRGAGTRAALRSLFRRQTRRIETVRENDSGASA
jgi:ABC-type uncharacterized transport system ATPase subunit